MTFKCKMCGGELALEEGSSVGECQYCGSAQTVPRLDDDKRANLYERAGHFRRQNDFDKAAALYETILNEDRTDAEAYWSLVLCKYGVEYVEDPATKKRVITCHRTQFASVLADEDYKQALANANESQRGLYEGEAKAIDGIQKGILEVSSKEEPFDVFICYKETDASGKRTPDSVLAQDLYHQLTNEGFKVFFSRITLEDKLGSAYEPYIFAALQSSKIMVAVGTKPEFFNAVWVKNEWGRYLALIKGGAKKAFIPAYKDMDPYSLPDEFSHLQAQDMGKLGFMQDLIRGIKKIINPASAQAAQAASGPTHTAATASTQSLMQRAFIELEDGNWAKADELLEQVLNVEPQSVRAYVGKLMASLKVGREADLARVQKRLADQGNFQKAMRFADDAYKATLQGYSDSVEAILDNLRKQAIYDAAVAAAGELEQATKSSSSLAAFARDCRAVAGQFRAISGFSDADKWAVNMEGRAAKGDAMSAAELKRENRSKAVKKSIKLAILAAILVPIAMFTVVLPLQRKAAAKLEAKKAAEAARVAEINAIDFNTARNADNKENEQLEFEASKIDKQLHRNLRRGWAALDVSWKEKYPAALALLSSGKYDEAIQAINACGGYLFGGNQWRILEIRDGKAFLLMEYELKYTDRFNKTYEQDVTWETCTLRKYLNADFYQGIKEEERARILKTAVSNEKYGPYGGKDTMDYVFLLSKDEAEKYFPVQFDRISPRASLSGLIDPWWLRTPGTKKYAVKNPITPYPYSFATIVTSYGRINDLVSVSDDYGIRPAMWVKL